MVQPSNEHSGSSGSFSETMIAEVDGLLPLVYDEMRALAASMFRSQKADHTLQPTALVHEAYARIQKACGERSLSSQFRSRSHFMAVAAKAMRQILANHARDRRAQKRGGQWSRVTLTHMTAPTTGSDIDVLVLDELLSKLADLDPRQNQIVELRFFADMSNPEIAQMLGTSVSTVEREWRMARAWLASELAEVNA